MKSNIISIFITLTLTLLLTSYTASSQTKNDLYFVFTSVDSVKKGFVQRYKNINLNSKVVTYKEKPIGFVFTFENGYGVAYWHFYRTSLLYGEKEVDEMDKHIVIEKPISFLNTIDYYDWDAIKGYEYSTWEQITNKYIFNKNIKVFFIDRNDIKNGKIRMYQVHDMTTKLYMKRDSIIVI